MASIIIQWKINLCSDFGHQVPRASSESFVYALLVRAGELTHPRNNNNDENNILLTNSVYYRFPSGRFTKTVEGDDIARI